MTQYENDDKYSKFIKGKSTQSDYPEEDEGRKRGMIDIADIKSFALMFAELTKYPLMYLCCDFITFRVGMRIHGNYDAEQFLSRYGNIYYLLSNVLFVSVCCILLSLSGHSIISKFSMFRDIKSLTSWKEKSIKSRFKRLKKKSKELFRKGITVKHVILQYLIHFFVGVAMGGLFLSAVYFLERVGLMSMIRENAFIRMNRNRMIGAFTFCFMVPLAEEIIYHAHNMTVLRKDFGVIKSSVLVTLVYLLFHFKTSLVILYVPIVFMMSVVFDKTRNIRNSALYVSGQPVSAREEKANIISIKDRLRNGTRNTIVNDTKRSNEVNVSTENHNITKLHLGTSAGSKPDITYSLLINTGFHMTLIGGWMICFVQNDIYRAFVRWDNVMLVMVICAFLLHRFIVKQHILEDV